MRTTGVRLPSYLYPFSWFYEIIIEESGTITRLFLYLRSSIFSSLLIGRKFPEYVWAKLMTISYPQFPLIWNIYKSIIIIKTLLAKLQFSFTIQIAKINFVEEWSGLWFQSNCLINTWLLKCKEAWGGASYSFWFQFKSSGILRNIPSLAWSPLHTFSKWLKHHDFTTCTLAVSIILNFE